MIKEYSWKLSLQRLLTLKSIAVYLIFVTKWILINDFDSTTFAICLISALFIRTFESVQIKTPLFTIGGKDGIPENGKGTEDKP